MARLFDSLRNTRWVIWSSPVLLLILVFTLRTHPLASGPSLTPSTLSLSTTSVQAPIAKNVTTTTSIRPRPATINAAPARVPPANSAVASSRSTVSNVAKFATASGANANTDALSGSLRPGDARVVLPLNGPGTWTLSADAGLRSTLICGPRSVPVASLIEVGAGVTCQLNLQATQATSWQLTPLH